MFLLFQNLVLPTIQSEYVIEDSDMQVRAWAGVAGAGECVCVRGRRREALAHRSGLPHHLLWRVEFDLQSSSYLLRFSRVLLFSEIPLNRGNSDVT
jgi:hypothetical protein